MDLTQEAQDDNMVFAPHISSLVQAGACAQHVMESSIAESSTAVQPGTSL